jgi:hypothetical protein
MHIVSYGEPAIVFQLNAHGIDAAPVADFAFLAPGQPRVIQPAFLMAMPNSLSEFERLIAPYTVRLPEATAIMHGTPSDLVLLDKYAPSDLIIPGLRYDDLRVYRIDPPARSK